MLLFASGLDNLTNDLPIRPAFVPFVDRAARFLSGNDNVSGSRLVDSFVPLRTSAAANPSAGVEIIDPDGRRALSLTEAAKAQSFQLTRAGFYRIRFANGRDALIGVNPDRRESNLEPIAEDLLRFGAAIPRRRRPQWVTCRKKTPPVASGGTLCCLYWWRRLPSPSLPAATSAHRGRRHEQRQPQFESTSNQDTLNLYIHQLHQRLRLGVSLRGVAILFATALITTIFLVLILNRFAFPVRGLTGARSLLLIVIACAAALRSRFRCCVSRAAAPRWWRSPLILNSSSGCSLSMTGKRKATILSSSYWLRIRFP